MDIVNANSLGCQETQMAIPGFEDLDTTAEKKETPQSCHKKLMDAVRKTEPSVALDWFFKVFSIAAILRQCCISKIRGTDALAMFRFLVGQVFREASIYRMEKAGKLPKGISTSGISRFLCHGGYNWEKFLTLLSEKAFLYVDKLNDPGKEQIIAMDDSDYDRNPRSKYTSGGKHNTKKKARPHKGRRTELVSKKYDHARKRMSWGFRMLTTLWTDGTTKIPLSFCLLASNNEENVFGDILQNNFFHRSLQYMRRNLAREKATTVMLALLKRSIKATGNKVKYVAADRWFSDPKTIFDIVKQVGLQVIAPLKHNKTKYLWNGTKMTITEIHRAIRKRGGRCKWFASTTMEMCYKQGRKETWIPVKVVFVHHKSKSKEWIAFVSTDTDLTEEEIIKKYALRFDIEHFFKTVKLWLGLTTECHATSYDAIVAHTTIVFLRYIMLAIEERKAEDDRTIGDIMFLITEQMQEIQIGVALDRLAKAIFSAVESTLKLDDEVVDQLISKTLELLPEDLRNALCIGALFEEERDEQAKAKKTKSKKKSA